MLNINTRLGILEGFINVTLNTVLEPRWRNLHLGLPGAVAPGVWGQNTAAVNITSVAPILAAEKQVKK